MSKYILTLKFAFEADDDSEARYQAHDILQDRESMMHAEVKLQRLYKDRPPKRVVVHVDEGSKPSR